MKIFSAMASFYNRWMSGRPLLSIIFIALLLRLVAAFFSKGYGMHDDHFLVIEASQSWVDGTDYNNWLPQNQINPKPEGHSFFYVGIQYVLFYILKGVGIVNPDLKMLIDRLLHALLSLLVVVFGYKITFRLAGEKAAKQAGLLLAMFWFMPFLSVRNLVEIVAIPVLMLGLWIIIDAEQRKNTKWWIFTGGVVVGIAFSIRFQTILFIGGIGLALLIMKKWREAFIMGVGTLLSIVVVQGLVDFFIWGRPFAELTEYVVYNMTNKGSYGNNNYLMYPEVVLGVLIPPLSIFLVFGFFRTWKKYLIIFLPVIVFFAFHEYFPNKQERFILTVVPFIIVTGVPGWMEFLEKSEFWRKRPKVLKNCMLFFWILNFLLLVPITTAYSKKSRIEAMLYLYPDKSNIEAILLENNNKTESVFLPLFYLGKWVQVYQDVKDDAIPDSLFYESLTRYQKRIRNIEALKHMPDARFPQYVLFYGDIDLDLRVKEMKNYYPELQYEKTIQPSNLDKLLFKLNPVNVNQTVFIYRTRKQSFINPN